MYWYKVTFKVIAGLENTGQNVQEIDAAECIGVI